MQNMVLLYNPPFFDLKLVYSYVFEVADFESDLAYHHISLVSEIFVFLLLRAIITSKLMQLHVFCNYISNADA